MRCPSCSNLIDENVVYCGMCGAPLVRGNDDETVVRSPYDTLDTSAPTTPATSAEYVNRGRLLYRQGKLKEAVSAYDEAIRLNQNYVDVGAHSSRGYILLGLGRYEEALSDFGKVLQLRPNSFGTHVDRGKALLGLGRYEEALSVFDELIQLDPKYDPAYVGRHDALSELGRFDEADKAIQTAYQINPRLRVQKRKY